METIDYDLSNNEQFEKLFDMSIHQGTITSVDIPNNKADVDIDGDIGSKAGVEIFYHCEDGLTTSGATAFGVDDRVLVINEKGQCDPVASDLKIVGFLTELKSCGFQFRLTRGDGTLVDESLIIMDDFKLYDSDSNLVAATKTYNAATGYWRVTLTGIPDPNGYWVNYYCDDGIRTQYPYRYKTADKNQVADLILPGQYEDTIPYWKTEDVSPTLARYFSPDLCPTWPPEVSEDYFLSTAAGMIIMKPGLSFIQKSLNVKSSIPYQVKRWVRTTSIPGYNEPNATFFGAAMTHSPSIYPGNCNGPGDAWCAGDTIWPDFTTAIIQFTGGSLNVTIDYSTAVTQTATDIDSSLNTSPGTVHSTTVIDLTPGSRIWTCEDGLYPGIIISGTKIAAGYDPDVLRITADWDY